MNKRLKARIIEKFGSQADFTQAMRLDESIVSRIIRGRRVLSAEDAKKWSGVLNCDQSILEDRD